MREGSSLVAGRRAGRRRAARVLGLVAAAGTVLGRGSAGQPAGTLGVGRRGRDPRNPDVAGPQWQILPQAAPGTAWPCGCYDPRVFGHQSICDVCGPIQWGLDQRQAS